MTALETLKMKLKPGKVYRREDLLPWSNAVDRHLDKLLSEKVLVKVSGGLYYCPKKTTFGEAPPAEEVLVEGFLKDKRFLIFAQSAFDILPSLKEGDSYVV